MITTGSIYREHEKIMSRVGLYLKNQSMSLRHCEDQAVYKRMTQKVSSITADEYSRHVDTHGVSIDKTLTFKHCTINTKTGECNIRFALIAKGIFDFFAMWFYFLLILLTAFFIKKDNESSVVLLFDLIPNIEKNDKSFVEFCKYGKIKPLQAANTIVSRVNSLPKVQVDAVVHKYTKRHPIEYCITNCLNNKQLSALFIQHLLLPFYFFKSIFNNSFNLLISQDLALVKIVNFLNRHSIVDAMVITTSWFQYQPIWMSGLKNRNFRLHMLWYSQNFIPKVYKNEEERSNLPSAKLMSVDEHWVWTDGFSQYLKSLGQASKIHVVGPILWFLQDINYVTSSVPQIVLFDVTPSENTNPFGCHKNYYSVELMEKFVFDVVKICNQLSEKYKTNISILLKHKRAVGSTHSKKYINFIEAMVSNGDIKLLDHNVNTFSIINESLLSISVPYTSTAYVASFLKKTSIYYDPLAEISPLFEKNDYIHFVSKYEDLEAFVEVAVIKKLQHA